MHEVLPSELRPLADLAHRLATKPVPRRELDREVHRILLHLHCEEPPGYTSDLNAAISLIPAGWWWHISHLEVEVIPNRPDADIPISNAHDYHFTGKPIGYGCHLWGVRDAIPSAICSAVILARCALKAKAAAIRDERMYLIQTGTGPMLVDRDGSVKELPSKGWLSFDGRLIAHQDAFPRYDFDPPAPDEDDIR